MDDVGVGLVEIGWVGRGEQESLRRHAMGQAAQRVATGFNRHRRRVLVEGRHRARALAASLAENRSDLGPLEPVVRNIGAIGNQARHATLPLFITYS